MALDGGNSGGGGGSTTGGTSREYCLRWNNHQPNMVSFLSALLPKESFADVTLVSAEGTRIQAHRIILSACSPYFEGVFESNPCKHPVVILKDVQFVDLRAIVTFIYNGEVNIEVDRINEIIQTATALQVKGLAEVPADEFKRVSLAGRCSSPAENPSPAPVTRTQPPPPLMSASARSWPSNAESSENFSDFPVRKKLKKSASANIPYSSGSSSTNGDVTNSAPSSFESGMGTSVSRSVDEGIGSDISSNEQAQSTLRPGPPPLTAANQLLPKSRSLDDGYQRKNGNNVEGGAMETGGGFMDQSGMDDSSIGQDGGYDDVDVEDGVKLEGVHSGGSYIDEQQEDDEEQVDLYFEDEQGNTEEFDAEEQYNNTKAILQAGFGFERPNVPARKIIPKVKLQKQQNNNNNNNNNATRSMLGVGHSLSLYRQQQHQPIRNFASRALIGKRRRGRPLLRQPRIKRLDNESSPGGGRDDCGSAGAEEQGYSSDAEPFVRTPSASCVEPQQQQHQARSASIDREISCISTNTSASVSVPSPVHKPTVPIVLVSQCSPTPPGSPQHAPSPKSESTSTAESASHSHSHHQLLKTGATPASTLTISGNTSASTLLTVPTAADPVSPSVTVRLASTQGHLVKQISQPLLPSHHYQSSEDESTTPSSSNPVIRRQHSQPVQSSSRTYPSYSFVGKGQLFHILKSEQCVRDDESAAYLVEAPMPMYQFLPAGGGEAGSLTMKEIPSSSHGESMSITLKEVGPSRTHSDGERPHPSQHYITSAKDSSPGSTTDVIPLGSHSEGQLVHRSGHCPALRPGPALGCNFCWNSVDSCGRVLRRKTKYFCPECHINLCIVPCFQEYHEKSDRKKKPRTKLGLPKPSSM